MRSLVINKILSFQYRLRKIIGRKRADRICIVFERTFTAVFGREVYDDKRWGFIGGPHMLWKDSGSGLRYEKP
jgi:hypothetical protein